VRLGGEHGRHPQVQTCKIVDGDFWVKFHFFRSGCLAGD
jgi:hypothetical protein